MESTKQTKICSNCLKEKNLNEFYLDKTHKDGRSSRCKECRKALEKMNYSKYREKAHERNKAWRELHKEQIALRMKQYSEANAETLKEKRNFKYSRRSAYVESLKKPCAKCGEQRLYVIDFHHIDPGEKNFAISKARAIKSLKAEVKKCICLCRNCHQEYHYFYGKNPSNPVESLEQYLNKPINEVVNNGED